ncbi:MAG: phosphoribosylglycinamide formyltransferase [Ectothiorhodospira sp.]
MPDRPLPGIVVLISGSGTNLQALIDAVTRGEIPGRIRAVLSNRPGVAGLERAERAGIPAQVIDHRTYPDRETFDQALMAHIDAHDPALVVLAGFMRVLTPAFVDHYTGRLINIHPSLLPDFRGLHTHERALEAGVQTHGCTVHFVNGELDGGPAIAQAGVPVEANDTPQSLAARVQCQEHRIYPQVVRWFCEGRLKLADDGQVHLDDQPLQTPLRADEVPADDRDPPT